MNSDLQIIIFSKDRALQLHSLLEGLKLFFNIKKSFTTVLYNTSTEKFKEGYLKLQNRSIFPNITWIEEHNFRENLISTVNLLPSGSPIMFLVDDDVIIREFDHVPLLNKFTFPYLYINLIYYPKPQRDAYLNFKVWNSFKSFRWTKRSCKGVYQCYPFSLDAHIYRRETILPLLKKCSFKAPNTLEGILQKYKRSIKHIIYNKAMISNDPIFFNNPANKVQDEGETWHNTDISAEELNDKYCNNYCIDNNELIKCEPTDDHFYQPLCLKKIK